MKANELRIGNILKQGIVTRVTQESAQVKYMLEGNERHSYVDYEYLEPIPLTEEWLLKFGFSNGNNKVSNCDLWNQWWIGNFDIFKEPDNEWDYDCVVTIKYVHQLQNLYFALTGKDLSL